MQFVFEILLLVSLVLYKFVIYFVLECYNRGYYTVHEHEVMNIVVNNCYQSTMKCSFYYMVRSRNKPKTKKAPN